MRGATWVISALQLCDVFQSTLPMRGATRSYGTGLRARSHFNPRSPCGERPAFEFELPLQYLFQSTLPMRGATQRPQDHGHDFDFNPRSPCGERLSQGVSVITKVDFNPRSPCGERLKVSEYDLARDEFQSTLPMRGATPLLRLRDCRQGISIHAPHAGSDRYIVYANIKCYAIYWTVEQLICCYCISSRHLLNLCTAFKVRRVLAHDDHLEFAPQNDKNPCGS